MGGTNEPVTYRFRSYSKLIIRFTNTTDINELLSPNVELTKRIGSKVDIRGDEKVTAALKYLEEELHYEVKGYPENDRAYVVTTDAEQVLDYDIIVSAKLTVQFTDENNVTVETLNLMKRIGSIDLTEDKDVIEVIKTLKEQSYEVIKRPENEKNYPVRIKNDPVTYQVKKTEISVKIRFVDESGIDIPKVELINSTAINGSILDLKKFETEIQKRLKILEEEHYELVESQQDGQVITESLELFYRFKGSLFIGSFPETLNFGDKYLSNKVIKAEQPKYDKPLIIKDTRKSKTGWQLTATLEKPLTSEENQSEVINNVFYYRQTSTNKVPLLTGEAQPIEIGTSSTTAGEYNISNKWTENKTGVELSVYSSEVNQTGKYTASILWQVETTP